MKKVHVAVLSLIAAALLVPSSAFAGGGFRTGFGFGHSSRHGSVHGGLRLGIRRHGHSHHRGRHHRRRVTHHYRSAHHHTWAPYYRQVWVAPVYRSTFWGYDAYRRPIYQRVVVRAGYYHNVLSGHRCACGVYR